MLFFFGEKLRFQSFPPTGTPHFLTLFSQLSSSFTTHLRRFSLAFKRFPSRAKDNFERQMSNEPIAICRPDQLLVSFRLQLMLAVPLAVSIFARLRRGRRLRQQRLLVVGTRTGALG